MKKRLATIAAFAGGAYALGRFFRGAPRRAPTAPGFVREIDGEQIHYVDEGSGPPMVLIHGFGCSTFQWRKLVPLLSAAHRVIAIDLPGFGFSDRNPEVALSHERHADRVVRLMDTLGIGRATLIGHSMGGGIAQRVAVAYPRRVDHLVLVCSVNASESIDRPRWRGEKLLFPLVSLALRSPKLLRIGVRRALRASVADASVVDSEMVEGYAAPLSIRGTAACLKRLSEESLLDAALDLALVIAPTLVVSGSLDRVVPVTVGEAVTSRVLGARHTILPSGHCLPEEQPSALVEEILVFLHESVPA